MYPDVEILRIRENNAPAYEVTPPIIPAQFVIPVLEAIEVRVATVEMRNAANNQLVTCIEILSPVNKREPGLNA
jgi:hypothetical protein